ncbi:MULTISPECIES: thiamine pyrophosphate-dependent enzyme [Lutispora]|uniref:Thiamine pyrophosphate-dependent enzyme n=2 Tax=root TaxID=1 RepID=A0ABT1ND98_9FIRM|nr:MULTISPECIES: thiamine pyrophosphate-dependent enzyme [Lutispora]MCQ1529227.1 thiamine pyrophosphate-dependent enzyme [Lutispora saccharofermentans]MEA4960891.1 thiamine pyrophosphate-dependent enzyme [Lutispora sp.]
MSKIKYDDYLIKEKLPLFWCSGCGNGTVLGAILRAFATLELDKKNTVVVTGIGCWGKADDYISTNTFHGTHGRALSFATGIKLANPKLKVIALMGDGDGATIGGNHLIHTARRNVDITAIVVNNFNYGMTGGQYSGTTPEDSYTATSRYGHIEPGFDLCKLVEAAGAPYVARGSAYNVVQLEKLIRDGIEKKGFSFIEAISPCPTHFGRLNGMRTAPQMLKWIKENSVAISGAEKLSREDREKKFIMGKFTDKDIPDYSQKYQSIIESCTAEAGGGINNEI